MQAQLKGFLEELPEVETHLVLSATTKPRDLVDIVQRFEGLKPGRLIFTKLDETSTYGPMLSTLVRIKRPLSYLGTGQEVPDDLELAAHRRVKLDPPTPLRAPSSVPMTDQASRLRDLAQGQAPNPPSSTAGWSPSPRARAGWARPTWSPAWRSAWPGCASG